MSLEPGRMAEAIARNAHIRDEGTRNLLTAAAAAGARRVVAQSIAWAYAPGPEPHRESDPLDLGAVGSRAVSVRGIAALEYWILKLATARRRGTSLWAVLRPRPGRRCAHRHDSMSMLPPALRSLVSTRLHPASSTLSSLMTTLPPSRQPHSSAGMSAFVSSWRAGRTAECPPTSHLSRAAAVRRVAQVR